MTNTNTNTNTNTTSIPPALQRVSNDYLRAIDVDEGYQPRKGTVNTASLSPDELAEFARRFVRASYKLTGRVTCDIPRTQYRRSKPWGLITDEDRDLSDVISGGRWVPAFKTSSLFWVFVAFEQKAARLEEARIIQVEEKWEIHEVLLANGLADKRCRQLIALYHGEGCKTAQQCAAAFLAFAGESTPRFDFGLSEENLEIVKKIAKGGAR